MGECCGGCIRRLYVKSGEDGRACLGVGIWQGDKEKVCRRLKEGKIEVKVLTFCLYFLLLWFVFQTKWRVSEFGKHFEIKKSVCEKERL